MFAGGLGHWASVHQIVGIANSMKATEAPAPLAVAPAPAPLKPADPAVPAQAAAPSPEQQHFYEALISRIEGLQNQNRDLIDQLAETNRDLMKLEFRVDTHSASFRPLPVNHEQPYTSLDADIGVLPPREEPMQSPVQD
jgi:hypothetical protein